MLTIQALSPTAVTTMTAEPPHSPVTEAVRSLEVRWIFPGQLETAVASWFSRFPAAVESARTRTCWIRSCAGCR